MAYDGSTLVAKYFGENINLLTAPLEQLLQRRELDRTFFMKDVLKKVAFVHARGIFVGAEFLSFEHIFIADSTEGPKAILTIQKESSFGTVEDDIRAAGRLFCTIWAKLCVMASNQIPAPLQCKTVFNRYLSNGRSN